MITDKDLDKLSKVFVTKQELSDTLFSVEERLGKIMYDHIAVMDSVVKRIDGYYQEFLILNNQVNRHEKWHRQTASVLDMHLEE